MAQQDVSMRSGVSSHSRLISMGGASLEMGDGTRAPLRAKDLALLYFLSLEGDRLHSKSYLAGLLWAETSERNARHSLNQALARIRGALGVESVWASSDQVQWQGGLEIDARVLEALVRRERGGDPYLEVYRGDFLAHFDPGPGAGEFLLWADGKRAEYRTLALEFLDRAGLEAEQAGDWDAALAYGRRAVAVDRGWEAAHRRIIRTLAVRGDRRRALQHYAAVAAARAEDGDVPEAETQALAVSLQQAPASRPEASAVPPAPPATVPPAAAAGEPDTGWRGGGTRPSPVPPSTAGPPPRRRARAPGALAVAAVGAAAFILFPRLHAPDVPAGMPDAPSPAVQALAQAPRCTGGDAAGQLVEEVAHFGIQLRPGTPFLKAWTLQNTGACTWSTDFRLHFRSAAERMSTTAMDLPVLRPVPPGDTLTFRVQMRAPSSEGTYDERWELRDGANRPVPVGGANGVVARVVVPSARSRPCGPGESTGTELVKKFMDGVFRVPGERFRFGWTLKNSGSCAWSRAATFRFASAASGRVTQVDAVQPDREVAPGESYTFLVPVRSPATAGSYQEEWSLMDGYGAAVPVDHGRRVHLQFRVPEPSAPRAQLPLCMPGQARVRFVDENWPDHTPAAPRQQITKRWTVFNVGDCAWAADFRLRFVSSEGARLSSGPQQLPLGEVVPPWTTYTFEVPMHMPVEPRTVTEAWRLEDSQGNHVFVSAAPYLTVLLEVAAQPAVR